MSHLWVNLVNFLRLKNAFLTSSIRAVISANSSLKRSCECAWLYYEIDTYKLPKYHFKTWTLPDNKDSMFTNPLKHTVDRWLFFNLFIDFGSTQLLWILLPISENISTFCNIFFFSIFVMPKSHKLKYFTILLLMICICLTTKDSPIITPKPSRL